MTQLPANANIRNMLLASLAPYEFGQILPMLARVWLAADDKLLCVDETPDFIYFPESSIVSVMTCTEIGRDCFIGLYGYEGCGGLAALLDASANANTEVVQLAGYANRMTVANLRDALAAFPSFRSMLLRYVHIFMMQIAYTAFSNGNTRVEQRLARWLLMYQDRLRGSTLAITHQRLSDILGVRRSGVTDAVHLLEGRKFIRAQRGLIDIVDRPSLEALTAGCYGKPEAEYRRLI
jgi:CRP-like cAMP-binding protein